MIEAYRMLGALLLVLAANLAPWAAGRVLRERWAEPLDGGLTCWDGRRLLGDHKTWRGVLAGELACALAARLFGYPFATGLEFAALGLTADAASSFVKRRLQLAPGTDVALLDQLPEALLPLTVLSGTLGISLFEAVGIAVVFLCLNLLAAPIRAVRINHSR